MAGSQKKPRGAGKATKATNLASDVAGAVREAGSNVIDKAVHAADSITNTASEVVRDARGSAGEPAPDPRLATGQPYPQEGQAEAGAAGREAATGVATITRMICSRAAGVLTEAAETGGDRVRAAALAAPTQETGGEELTLVVDDAADRFATLLADAAGTVAQAMSALAASADAAATAGSAQEAAATMADAEVDAQSTMSEFAARARVFLGGAAPGVRAGGAPSQVRPVGSPRATPAGSHAGTGPLLTSPDPADKFMIRDTAGDTEDHDIDLRQGPVADEVVRIPDPASGREQWLDPLEETEMEPGAVDVPRI